MNRNRMIAIMRGEDRSVGAALVRAGLATLEPGYRAAVAVRNWTFDAGLRKPVDLGRPVVSVGNITTGGTGKTPMVIHIARRLMAMGVEPCVLLRGYGADETMVLQAALGPRVEANPDRRAGARRILERQPCDLFILDDGFQHRQVRRDFDLVLIDATDPLGMGRTLPRGFLREPIANLRRADAVIVTRADGDTAELDRTVESLTGKRPIAHARFVWDELREGDGDSRVPLDRIAPLRVVAVCGVGNPGAFERQLRPAAADVAGLEVFPDHHAYTADDVQRLVHKAKSLGAQAIVTTEKDWVKWRALGVDLALAGMPIYRPTLRVEFREGDAVLDALLQPLAASRPRTT